MPSLRLSSSRAALTAALACFGAFACSRRPAVPAPLAAVASNAPVCGGCHAEATREWTGSMHHLSFTSPDFQRSYRAEPRAFCIDCHAPRRSGDGHRDGDTGVGCNECHDVPARHLEGGKSARVARTTTRACAPCHDFPVPNTRADLQTTVREHAESPFASTSCTACHMRPRGPSGGHDHAFAVSRNAPLLASAITVDEAYVERNEAVVVLRTRGVGHRFPTGDIFRRITVGLAATDATGALVGASESHMNRDWDEHRRSMRAGTVERTDDSRMTSEPRVVRAECVRPPTRVRITITYARGVTGDGERFESFEETDILDVTRDLAARDTASRPDRVPSQARPG